MRRNMLVVPLLVLAIGGLTSCNEDQESCNNLAGNGNYAPKTEDGKIYCENSFNGDRFLLREE